MSEENQKREDIDPTTGLAYTTSEKYAPQKEWKTHPAWKDKNYQMDYNSEEDKPEISSVGMAMLLEKMILDKDEKPVDLSDFDINYTWLLLPEIMFPKKRLPPLGQKTLSSQRS